MSVPKPISTAESVAFPTLLAAVRQIATEVSARHAGDVDARARFPSETIDSLRSARVLSAPVPRELGGSGCSMRQLAELCALIGQECGSSAMVLAMHFIQVACMVRHGQAADFFRGYLRELAHKQYLLASITSEVGTWGNTRTSITGLERSNGRFRLVKEATTGSYCAHADGILVTSRRAPDAAPSDQVLVFVKAGDYTLTQTSTWDSMGMRGTCSPGFHLESEGPEEQILPGSYADSSAQSMVPYSHILWASLWSGIAAGAVARAAEYVRSQARKNVGTVPPTAIHLAEVTAQLQAMRHSVQSTAADFDELQARPEAMSELLSMGWALRFNNLKVYCSDAAPRIVHQALQITGILGYKNDSPYALSRHYRDALSASLMISNDRIAAKSASLLLVQKDL